MSGLEFLDTNVLVYSYDTSVLGETGTGLALMALGLAGGAVIYFDLSRRGWNTVTG